jgi:hypothetical protein
MRFAAGLLLVSLGLALAPLPASARCAMVGMTFRRIGTGDVSASAPSFLIGLRTTPGSRGAEATPASLSLITGGAGHLLAIDTLAPGLLRVRSTAPRSAGTYAIEGAERRLEVTLSATHAAAPLAAPQIVALTLSQRGRGGRSLSADLSRAVPAGAVAILVSSGGAAVAWNPVEPGATTGIVVVANGRCVAEPPGWAVPGSGSSVTLQFVDASGALSPMSSAVAVL